MREPRGAWWTTALIAVLLGIGVIYLVRQFSPHPNLETRQLTENSASHTQEAANPSAASAGLRNAFDALNAKNPSSHSSPKPTPSAAAWSAFKARFGEDLTAEFTSEGRLLSIRGMINGGKRASSDFKSSDPQKDIARAKEVLDAASNLLGIVPDLPLEKPIARADLNIAQVHFREAVDGVPVYPVGNVTLDIGPQGEVVGLYSNYVPNLRVVNSVQLDSETARTAAEAAVPDSGSSTVRTDGGAQVIWANPGEQRAEGRRAYEFTVRGRQVIVDAETGQVIANKDRRRN